MKLYIILLFTILISLTGFSQTFSPTASNPTSAITNTSVDTLTYTTSQTFGTISIQPVVTKATGTMAGTAILSYSIDGVNFINIDTLTLSNATTNSTVWNVNSACKKFMIIVGGSTTVTGTVAAKISGAN